jgi:hypothetical protein
LGQRDTESGERLAISEVRDFLESHRQAIFDGDVERYKATTATDLGLYEW